jgi:hypothetical protein
MVQNLTSHVAANVSLIQPMLESCTYMVSNNICNNSTLAMKLVNASGEIILPRLGNNSTIIIKLDGGVQNILNWSTLIGVVLGWILSQVGGYINSIKTTNLQDKRRLALLNQDWTSNMSIMNRNIALINQENGILDTKNM